MEAHTHREYLTWMAWLNKQWNEPSRTDHYIMQNTAAIQTIQRMLSKGAKPTSDLKIPFVWKKQVKLSQEERVARSKAAWGAALGIKQKHRGQ